MTKLERAIAELKKLPADMQEGWASMILAELEAQDRYTLTDEQVAEVRRRRAVKNPVLLSEEEAEHRIADLLK